MAVDAPDPLRERNATSPSRNGENDETDFSPLSTPNNERQSRRTSLQSLDEGRNLLQDQQHQNEESRLQGGASSGFQYDDGERQESKSLFYLFLLTLSIGGLQIAYAVELSNGSPYLLSLGMSKSLLALVWIAGPLSGTVVQPYIGIRSDNCRISWGKRRPFMLAGALSTAVSLLGLAWAREIVHGFLGLFGADPASHGVKVSSIVFAVILVYMLDVAVNTVQAGIRAFIVDNAPTHQQEDANAWAGRITGFGNILGYLSGYVDLPKLTNGVFGDTQFKVLCVIAAFALTGTVVISSLYIHERDPQLENPSPSERLGILSFFRQVISSVKRLPPQTRKVCEAQFFNWIGWFPFLFYITTYVGQIYLNPYFAANPDLTEEQIEKAWEEATRIGTFSLLIFAIISFASNILLPFFVSPSYQPPAPSETRSSLHYSDSPPRQSVSANSNAPNDLPGSRTSSLSLLSSSGNHSWLRRFIEASQVVIAGFQIKWLSLRRAWLLSHLLFALCMLATFFISSVSAATVLVGIIGIPWALSLWAPFALISAEISERETEARRSGRKDGTIATTEDQAGIVLGLHNVAVSAPQILATVVCSAIFKLAQKPRGTPGDESVSWVLRFGGVAALIAAYMTYRIDEKGQDRRSGIDNRRYGEV